MPAGDNCDCGFADGLDEHSLIKVWMYIRNVRQLNMSLMGEEIRVSTNNMIS